MALITQKNALNIRPGTAAQLVVHVSQGDTGSNLEFYLYNGSDPYEPDGVSIALDGMRKTGTGVGPIACTYVGNLVTVQTTAEMTAEAGPVLCELIITNGSSESIGTANFAILVEEATFPDGPLYNNSVDVYSQILAYVQTIPASVDESVNARIAVEKAAREAADSDLESSIDALETSVSSLQSGLASETSARTAADALLQTEIDNIIAPSGEAPSAAEVQNARIGADGTVYDTLGNAIRGQVTDLKSQIDYTQDTIGYGKNLAFGARLVIGTRSTTGIYATTPGSTALNKLFPVTSQSLYRVKISGASTETLRYYFYSANDETTLLDTGTVALVGGECLVQRQNNNGAYMSLQINGVEIPGYFVSVTVELETQSLYDKVSDAVEGYFRPVIFTSNTGILSGNVNGNVSINTGATGYSYAIIDVEPGEVYRFSCAISGSGNHLIRFVNASNKIIQRSYNGVNSYSTRYEGAVTVPKNATKMYVNWHNLYGITIQKLGFIESENLYSIVGLDLFLKSGLVTGCTSFTPTVSANTAYKHCVIMCSPGDKFTIAGAYSGANNIFLAELDTSGNIISASEVVGSDGVISTYNGEYIVSSNGYGLILCGLYAYPLTVEKKIYKTNEEISEELTAVKSPGTFGKTAVVFGTSIPAGKVTIKGTEYTIPSYMAKLCGMTVYNESIGSSCARRGWRDKASANDSYGWTDIPWQNVFLAMGKNLTECADLIDNYDTKWKDLIGGDFAPSGQDDTGLGKPNEMTTTWAAKIRAASYENILVPYLDGTKPMPDLFIFEHGHNDVKSFDKDTISGIASVNPNDIADLDRSLYGDVMAFFIRLIWQANPRAKILIVSNYENDSDFYHKVFTSQKEVAESNKVWFCDVANNIGWSDVKKITTTGYWTGTPGTWVPSGGTSQVITCLGAAFPDKVHPHTDQSGNAVVREAEIIANYIKSHIML